MQVSAPTNVSIIIPTFREANNITELVKRLAHVNFGDRQFEVLLIDDNSQDGIQEIALQLSAQYPWLKLIIRHDKKGLSESVIEGFQHARFPYLVVMDADLSHPPEKIPPMLTWLDDPAVDIVIGSRYIAGGSTDESWPLPRKMISRAAASLAKALLPHNVMDPLSGFLAVRKTACLTNNLEAIGWKIGLEIMIKCRCKTIKEVPIHFAKRHQGKSKLTLKVAASYLQHIKRLLLFKLLGKTC